MAHSRGVLAWAGWVVLSTPSHQGVESYRLGQVSKAHAPVVKERELCHCTTGQIRDCCGAFKKEIAIVFLRAHSGLAIDVNRFWCGPAA